MYNGVGLPTPRGSGTSGYVQKNLAYVNKTTSKMQFQRELEAINANPPKPPKQRNKAILEHDQKRQIEIQLMVFKEKLEEEGWDKEEIEAKIKRARGILHNKLNEAPVITENTPNKII
jgi:cwf21.